MSFAKIQVEQSTIKHSRFDFSKQHYATARWGEVSPSIVRTICTPDQKLRFSSSKLARLSPMISPAYGKIRLKEYFQFVPWRSIFKGCEHFLSQVDRLPDYDKLMQRVSIIPRVETAVFMYYLCCRRNSHGFIWKRDNTQTDPTQSTWTIQTSNEDKLFKPLFGITATNLVPWNEFGYETDWSSSDWQFDPDAADYRAIVTESAGNVDGTYAIKLTQRGCRFQKLLLGAGYPISFQLGVKMSALHLFAVYKAYFDIFQIKQYQNYEETALYKLIRFYDTNNCSLSNEASLANLDSDSTLKNMWFRFFDELTEMFYTANADAVSSEIPLDWNVSAPELSALNAITELSGIKLNWQPTSASRPTDDTNVFFDTYSDIFMNPGLSNAGGVFNQLSDEFIKKAYYYTNKKLQIGNNIADLLRARGMGGFVDLLDSGFLGKTETSITVSEVISTADTTLRALGDYAGQASEFDKSSNFYLHNNEVGVLVGLYCVVPESHLSNSPDLTLLATTPQDFYNPIFDGLGYEGQPRLAIGHDEALFHQNGTSQLLSTFGLNPRYQNFKVQNDTRSGGFALRSQRDTYDPFHLSKLISCHENEVVINGTIAANGDFKDNSLVSPVQQQTFPNAGYEWRYPARYDNIGHYDRIFDIDYGLTPVWWSKDNDLKFPNDNFMLFFEINVDAQCPMLPVSKTFETIECETEGANTFTSTK